MNSHPSKFNLSRCLKWLSILCFILAIGCFAYEPVKSHLVNHYQVQVNRQTVNQGLRHKSSGYDMSKVKPVTMSQAVSARMHAKHLPVIGQILVPSVGLHLPIGKGVGNETLMLAAGTMKANEKMGQGNYALAGHHMINKSALFTPLWFHAHKGTQVYITNMKKVYVYKINVRKVISPYDVNVINNTKQPILTLITCNDSGSKRLLLQGHLRRTVSINHVSPVIRKDVQARTNNHDVLKGY